MFDENSRAEPATCGVMDAAPTHILIIDDDRDQANVLAHRFQKLNFQVTRATTGAEGLALAAEIRPHLIILDLRLPDRDGFGICQELSDNMATCDIPVIIVSGMEGPDIIRRARLAGCRYYLRKPYDPNALLTLVQDALSD